MPRILQGCQDWILEVSQIVISSADILAGKRFVYNDHFSIPISCASHKNTGQPDDNKTMLWTLSSTRLFAVSEKTGSSGKMTSVIDLIQESLTNARHNHYFDRHLPLALKRRRMIVHQAAKAGLWQNNVCVAILHKFCHIWICTANLTSQKILY